MAAAIGLGLVAASSAPIVGIDGGLKLSGGAATVVALVSALVLQAGWLLVWPAKWNVPALSALGLAVAAYVVPLLVFDELGEWPAPTVRAYLGLMTLGAAMLVAGLLVGNAVTGRSRRFQGLMRRSLDRLTPEVFARRAWAAGWAAVGLLAACFVAMRYVPVLAADPTAAKYLAGPYTITRKVAFAYHVAVATGSLVLLIVAAAAWETRRPGLVRLTVILAVLLLGTNQRGYAGTPLLALLLVGAAARKAPFIPALLLVLLLGPLGSTANYTLSHYFGAQQFSRTNQGDSLIDAVRAGAPDVPDALHSLSNYLEAPQPTHGKTFWANFSYTGNEYSPNQWALRLANPGVSDLSKVLSGGVRLPIPVWGFFAWGWWGAALVAFVAGIIGGLLVGAIRHEIDGRSLMHGALLVAPLISLAVWLRAYDYFRFWACIPALLILFWPVRTTRTSAKRAA